ncbi:MAG TPA: antibiotic biosynthesis monooxygenase [Ktedonobacterales bacterium]|nr:antibiotic biosynthesis monooxygenase [Ktedonobacterales bacterium]
MANQIMTVLEGHIASEHWAALTEGFARISTERPSELLTSYLVQNTTDPTLWRTVGVWSSQQAFDDFRSSVQAPPPLVLFRSLGAEPALAIFEIKG